jgi:molybdate transport system ATP-binding protein
LNEGAGIMSILDFSCRLRYRSGFQLDVAFATDFAVTALVGPSGSGKTTILSLLAGLRRPDAGRIVLGDRVLDDTAAGVHLPPESRRIGYVFQDHLLFPHLTVRENLLYGARRQTANAGPADFERAVKVLELGDLLARWPLTLSGGQRQRVALGRAILAGPKLLLLDEPLASLDQELKGRVLDYVEEVLREWRIPTLYVTHDPSEVTRFATWVVRLESGRVSSQGPGGAASREGVEGLAK